MLLFRCLFESVRTPSVLIKNFCSSSLWVLVYYWITLRSIPSKSFQIQHSSIHCIIWNSDIIVNSTTDNLYYQCLLSWLTSRIGRKLVQTSEFLSAYFSRPVSLYCGNTYMCSPLWATFYIFNYSSDISYVFVIN